ncbi:ciliated left-right organizer metallopeptidase [Solea solea]|uniref:ciliated left-right organizer metallopeptidase n=1 Tax=Solea solea TaxID=90069 RepID=UPI00272B5512|nr:ciliated left-right organizer metallopeptidase [Solea solea]
MPLPPPLRPWVVVVVVVLVVTVVVKPSGALQRCIFDEVQAQVRVVRAAPNHTDNLTNEPGLRLSAGEEHPLTAGQRTTNQGGRTGVSVKHRGTRREMTSSPAASPQPIRIHTWIPRESDNISDAERSRLTSAVEEAVKKVSSLLSVNRILGPLLLSRDVNKYCKFVWSNSRNANYNRCGRANINYRNETCLDVIIPDDHLTGCDIYPEPDSPGRTVLRAEGAGIPDTDFLLYLHIRSTDKCRAQPHVLAYAVHCQTDTHGRPVAGLVVICRHKLREAAYNHQTTVQTVIHELFHALGFSKDLFHTWRDCSSTTQGGAGCSPLGKLVHSDGSGQMRIYSQSVISALQEHLASADPELGGLLENLHVAAGRVSSHWESRVLRGSIMTAVLEDSTTVRIDLVTLAALQDTGWYTVNLSQAQSLVWGQGEGATFGSLSTCKGNSSSFFCTGSGLGCHFLHLHKGECQTDPYLEGCRVFKPLKNASECWKWENTRQSTAEERSGEIWGFDSRCFFSNLTRQRQLPVLSSSLEGRCYRHRCTAPNRYRIQVSGSDWMDCPAGGTIQIKGFQGLVSCPQRRLCLYPDITPPPGDVNPASHTSDPYEMFASVPVLAFAAAAAAAAAVCLLAVSYRKCRSCRDRIHTVPEDHSHP